MNAVPSEKLNVIHDKSDSITICDADELTVGVGVCALLNDKQIALFKISDNIICAIGNYDPKSKAYVLSRGMVGDIKGEPVVASPMYKQHYSLLTGICLEDESLSVPVYEVNINSGKLSISPFLISPS